MQTVALLLTDVVGSTVLWRDAPMTMNQAMARHHELVAAAVAAHGGWRPVDQGEGDSTFSAFDSPAAALAAALQLQRACAAECWPTPTPLMLRIGVHVGEVISRDGNLFGEAVSRCARIRGIGHGGQTLLSTAAYELVRDALPSGASLRSLGAHRMRDLVRPEGVWQLDHPDLTAEFPPLTSLELGRHNLPVQLTSFVGREAELADLTSRMRDGARLVTIRGFGGMGKTRLALAVAAGLVDGSGDGVWFVDLSGVADTEAVPREIATVLAVRDTGEGMAEAVLDHLVEKRLVLVLDNLEQILGCASFVARLLASAPGVQVLGTSREPLGLRGEVVYALEPFPTNDVDGIGANSAVTLFTNRARDAVRDFTVDAGNAAAVAAICARLDGVPLALELAAARVNLLTPPALLARLEQSLAVLVGAERDRPDRHRTVRATVAWSYHLLTGDEQTLLSRLSVFPSTAGLDAVEAVCTGLAGSLRLEVFPLLASLVDKSLVRRSQEGDEPRFSLLVSVRAFAIEQLGPQERHALAEAHLAYYLARSVAGALTSDGPDESPWHDELHRDAHNFRAALMHAESAPHPYEHLLLAVNLFEFWRLGGHWVEGSGHVDRALSAVGELSHDPALAACAACMQVWLSPITGAAGAVALAQRALEMAEQSSDLTVMAFAHQTLANNLSDTEAVRASLEQATRLAQAARDAAAPVRWGTTRPDAVEFGVGTLLVHLDRWDDRPQAIERARELRERAAAARRDGDDGVFAFLLGQMAADVGDLATAEPLFDRTVQMAERRHDDYWLSSASLARACARVRRGVDSVEDLAALLDRVRHLATSDVARAEVLAGDLQAVHGDLTAAKSAYQRVLAASRNITTGSEWRLLRLDRLAGRDTRTDLEELFQRKRQRPWHRPDLVGCLVEAAAAAEQYGQPDRAAVLIATVMGIRGEFLLPEIILADLAQLTERYATEAPPVDLPTHLFAS